MTENIETTNVVEAETSVEKEVNYILYAEILNVDPDAVESLVEVETLKIESISKISAEDRARRFFRKNEVPMDHVVRDVVSETEATWTGFVGEVPEDRKPAKPEKPAKASRKPRVSKTTPEEVFNGMVEVLDDLYGRWQDEKDYEDWADYEAVAKSKVEIAQGVKMVSFTNRPFQLVFRIGKDEARHVIGRNRSGGFELKS